MINWRFQSLCIVYLWCHKKRYHSVIVDGKEAKVTFHKFPPEYLAKRRQWTQAIRRDVGKYFRPGKWTKICSLHFKPTQHKKGKSTVQHLPSEFDNYSSSCRSAGGTKAAHRHLLCRSSPLKDRNFGSGS